MLFKKGSLMALHYLDNAATTRLSDRVLGAMQPYFQTHFGNPSSLHSLGVEAENALKNAREKIARALRVKSKEVTLTSGGTESNNLALRGLSAALKRRGKHIVCSNIEHPSVLETCSDLEAAGFRITQVAPQSDGLIHPEDILAALEDDTILVTVMHIQNETGAINPIDAIAQQVAQKNPVALIHVDGVQAIGKAPFPGPHIHSYSLSGHKLHGPKGSGALILRGRARLCPQQTGGGQERGLRSGTENVPGAVGLGEAVAAAVESGAKQRAFWQAQKELLAQGIEELGGRVNSPEIASPSILNASFPGYPAEVLLHMLESHGVYVSNGSACASKKSTESHVLKALGLSPDDQKSALRFSMGWETRPEDISAALEALKSALNELSPVKRRGRG
ncbi:MAG: cysteine desulfurase family protein, partial [Planctomycetota bacterium]|nr:cysteine desulfurase family protein [Planctomycetota bacterium]